MKLLTMDEELMKTEPFSNYVEAYRMDSSASSPPVPLMTRACCSHIYGHTIEIIGRWKDLVCGLDLINTKF